MRKFFEWLFTPRWRGIAVVSVLAVAIIAGSSYVGYRLWRHYHVPQVALTNVTEDTTSINGEDALIVESTDTADGARPLALVTHGVHADHRVLRLPYMAAFTQELADAGWIVASSAAHGDAWGDTDSIQSYVELYEYVVDTRDVSEVVIISVSMGAISGLNIIADDLIPVTEWVGVSPVTDLPAMSKASLSESVKAALTADEIAALNPLSLDLPPIPMTVYSSPLNDPLTPTAVHATPFGKRFSATVIECEGGHVAADCFRASDLID